MLCVQPLIQAVRTPRRKLSRKILQSWSVICEIISIVQLVLQLLGIYDLKEMLKLTHIMIAVSSLVLIISVWIDLTGFSEKEKKEKRYNAAWLLGVGALLDLFFYYTGGNKTDLLFVLIAILCYVLIEGVQVFFIYIKQKTMLEEIEKQLTLSRLSTMLSQIRSHFVFNILNAISGMCKYDPEKADETVIRFARYLRSNIDIMEDDRPVLFSAELNHLEDYVLLEQIRFGDKIQFYTEVNTDQFKIPPLILQPIVENAIKHGLRKKPTGGTVILRTWEEAEAIKITVEDDGVGFELSELEKKESIGLKNIRYRLYHLIHATLTIESNVGKGTIVTISIPKNGGV